MKEFIKEAAGAAKIARAKNNFEDLAIFSKNIGSNFFLMDRQLVVEYKKPLELVKSFGGGATAATCANADSLSELRSVLSSNLSKYITPELGLQLASLKEQMGIESFKFLHA